MLVPARSRPFRPMPGVLLLALFGFITAPAGAQMSQATTQFSSRTNTPQFLTEMDRALYFVAEWRKTATDPYLKQVICYNRTTNQTTDITNFTYNNADEMSIGPLFAVQYTVASKTYHKLLFAARATPGAEMRLYAYTLDALSGQPFVKEVSSVRGACNWVKFNNQVYFRADNTLYTYNPVNDIVTHVVSASLNCPTLVGTSLNFRRNWPDLVALSGSTLNQVSTLYPYNPQSLIGYGGDLYFGARSSNGFQLYKNNGAQLTSYNTAGYGLKALAIYGMGSRLVIKNQTHRYYFYDYTNPSLPTQGFYSIAAGAAGSNPEDGIIYKNKLYFSANYGGVQKLFVLGPVDALPALFGDLSNPSDFYVDDQGDADPANDLLYFSAADAANGKESWQTNGTVRTLLGNIVSGAGSADPKHFTMAGRSIFCTAKNGGTGRDIWYKFLATSDLNPPVLGGVTSTLQTINDNQTVNPFANVTVTDADTPLLTIRVRLDDPSRGAFTPESLAASGFTLRDAGRYILENRSPAQCQSALRALVFRPIENKLPPVSPPNGTPLAANYETTTFTILVDDGISPIFDNSQTQVRSVSVNDAPVIVGAPTLPAVNEDTISPPGHAISNLLPYPTPTPVPAVYFSDPDLNAARGGIAVVGNTADDSSEGAWQYSTNSGTNWYAIGNVNDAANALVLGPSAMLRFVPVANFSGAAPALGIRALDNLYTGGLTSNATRVTVNTANHGNPYAISDLVYNLGVTITPINDAPQLIANASLASIQEDPATNDGATVGSLFPVTSHFTDVDPGSSLGGVAVMSNPANAASQGKWQYSTDGSNWFDIGAVAEGATALALSAATQLRFQPVANYNGSPDPLSVRAIDNNYASGFTNGAGRVTVNSTINGGITPISSASRSISIIVVAVVDYPGISGIAGGQAVNDKATIAPFTNVVISHSDQPPAVMLMSIDSYDRAKGDFTPASLAAAGFLDGGNAYTKTGTSETLTNAIRQLVFGPAPNRITPGQSEIISLRIDVDASPEPGFNSQNFGTTVMITSINDAPVIGSVPGVQVIADNTTLWPFSNMTITDVDNPAQTQTLTVTFDPQKGDFTAASRGGFTNPEGGTYIFTGTAAAAQAALRGLIFDPVENRVAPGESETSLFTIVVDDGAGGKITDSTISVIAASVNDPPVIGGTKAGQAVADNATIQPLAEATVSDPDNPAQTLTVTVAQDDILKGAWTAASLLASGFSDQGGGIYRFTGTAAQSQAALRQLIYMPVENRVPPGQSETTALSITVSDGTAGDVIDSVTTIVSTSINDAPAIAEGAAAEVTMDEDGSPIAFSLKLHASDADGDTLGWQVGEAAAHGTASAGGSGNEKGISYTPVANYHGEDTFVVTVEDGQGGTAAIRVNVIVTPQNDAPTMLDLSNASVAEHKPAGTFVGKLSAIDPDTSGTFTYSLIAGTGSAHNAMFAISGNLLETAASFNYETTSNLSIRVRATDNGAPALSYDRVFNIGVLNVNEAPTGIGLSPSSVAENKPAGTIVGTLRATDPDTSSTFAYSLASGTGSADNASFIINGDQLLTTASLNHEAKPGLSIRVRATDNGNPALSYERALVISVTNVNEAPTNISLAPLSVVENKPAGTIVGMLSTTDPDTSSTFAYSLVAGTGSADNVSFTISGNQVRTAARFAYNTKNRYAIRVRSKDQSGLSTEKAFTIGIVKENAVEPSAWKHYR